MMVSRISQSIPRQSPRRIWAWSVFFALAVLSSMAIWFVSHSMRRPFIGKTDPQTGFRFTFTLASGYPLVDNLGSGWSKKLDDLTFSLPKPIPLQTWLEKNMLPRTSYSSPYSSLKNEIHICSGDKILSGNRSPFRNFELQEDYPTPQYPDFVDRPGANAIEETHLLVSGQPALWRVTRVDLPPNPSAIASMRKGSNAFYNYTLVVKVKGKDLWFAVVGTGDEDHHRQIQQEVRSVGDSLRIEQVWGK